MTLRIVADENMPNVEAWFAPLASSIVRKPGRSLSSEDLAEADVLLVRSVTRVDQALLQGTPVKFVGSATIGTDHIDLPYLQSNNISFHHAPGCNAQSVCDWLLAVLSRLHLDHDLDWWQKTIGVVGAGNVGGKVVERLKLLGCRVLVCDPLRYEAGSLAEHTHLQTLLEFSDIVCLHTPHTRDGNHPTHHMIGQAQLEKMRAGSWLINAGRGPVIEPNALLAALSSGHIQSVLDVWPQEPLVPAALLNEVELASPHVAGYSLEGKFEGTRMLADALYCWAAAEQPAKVEAPKGLSLDVRAFECDDINEWLSNIVLAVYDPARDTVTMNLTAAGGDVQAEAFDQLRKSYPVRRELASTELTNIPEALLLRLEQLGFRC
ncbi:4-phosphoerythronate dehydrogenase [Reinekea marinisedimentorum]|uniref:Erythronate-4-phosphate dehydrogenase n=1 Tax=Reinekea marinisedimentorum TaxID=230495 RepID=A0A4R3I992_9GAMM|nr:4-phosphoerythronate dehydrogenase [Reinekea marinisedimentorum]TCS40818.1 erythronate-4-phosphate dehydrogenase [Reinekea marinisedimentorum]